MMEGAKIGEEERMEEAKIGEEEGMEKAKIGEEEMMEEAKIGEEEKLEVGGTGESNVPIKSPDEEAGIDVAQEEPAEKNAGDGQPGKAGAGGVAEERDAQRTKDGVKLGPKVFSSSFEMFNYFYNLLHGWPLNLNLNKYEFMVLLDLVQKGHRDPPKKIGVGIAAFQIRVNRKYSSRCFHLIRTDSSTDDLSYRKCVDKLLPFPANVKFPSGDLNVDSILFPGKDSHKTGSEKNLTCRAGTKGGRRGNRIGRQGKSGRGHGRANVGHKG